MIHTFWLIILVEIFTLCQSEDLTLTDKAVGDEVVKATIAKIQESCIFSDDKQMLERIAYVETRNGKAANTFLRDGKSYYGGIWQIDQDQFEATKDRTDLFDGIIDKTGVDWSSAKWENLVQPLYSGLACRIWMDTVPVVGNHLEWDVLKQATYWASTLRQGKDTDEYYKAVTALIDDCSTPKADIVFVLDGSGSIGPANFQTMLDFVDDVINAFEVSAKGVRIGVIQFSSQAQEEFYLGNITGKAEIRTIVQQITYMGGSTNTYLALDSLRLMFMKYGRDSGVPRIAIIMTDGRSSNIPRTKSAALQVHAEHITSFAIGVGSSTNLDELNTIGSDPDCIHVHHLDSFSDIAPFTTQINKQTCKAPATIVIPEGNDSFKTKGTLKEGELVYFKLNVSTAGLHFKVKMENGSSILYTSYKSRTPGPALHDYHLEISSSSGDGGVLNIPHPKSITKMDVGNHTYTSVEIFASLMGTGIESTNTYVLEVVIGLTDDFMATTAMTSKEPTTSLDEVTNMGQVESSAMTSKEPPTTTSSDEFANIWDKLKAVLEPTMQILSV